MSYSFFLFIENSNLFQVKHLTEMSRTEYSKYILEPSRDLRRISLSGYYQFMKYKEKQNKKML